MKEPLSLRQDEIKMLRFIMPDKNKYTVEVVNTKNGFIRQHYSCHLHSPILIMMHEENTIWENAHSSILYTFTVNGRDLILQSCVEKNHSEEYEEIHPTGYPYIRLPLMPNQKVSWQYQLGECIRINCTSNYTKQMVDGIDHNALMVHRIVEYSDTHLSNAFLSVECYVDGLGIQTKKLVYC